MQYLMLGRVEACTETPLQCRAEEGQQVLETTHQALYRASYDAGIWYSIEPPPRFSTLSCYHLRWTMHAY
jgi:hypothetical protein